MSDVSRSIVSEYAENALFSDAQEDEVVLRGSPFRRPTRNFDNRFINFDRPLGIADLGSNSSLSVQRLLLNIYEADMMFLPEQGTADMLAHMRNFYGYENISRGERARPILEKKAFSFLDAEVEVLGRWTGEMVAQYFEKFLVEQKQHAMAAAEADPLLGTILSATEPDRLARHYLIQLASDFLSEASAMARNITGNYGLLQSSLFNILIDEYGAGVHSRKHSTLFENTLESVGLYANVHAYWQFYHASSLALTNYFHYLTRNRHLFFRYLGALFFTEASLVNLTRLQSQMLRRVFGKKVQTTYFDEHSHIDQHHGDMALHRIVVPALERFGDAVAEEIILGFEQLRLLQRLADEDLIQQFEWVGNWDRYRETAADLYSRIQVGEIEAPLETFVEALGERSTTHTHPDDRLLVIERGSMDFWPLAGAPLHLEQGAVLYIPRHRLHGSVVRSAECIYHQPIATAAHAAAAAQH